MAVQKKSNKNHSRHYWQNHIRTHLESDLSRAEYCRRYNLSYHALSYWQRKLSKPSPLPTALVPVPDLKITSPHTSDQGSGVKIILDNDVTIEVTEQFSPVALNRVLSVLTHR